MIAHSFSTWIHVLFPSLSESAMHPQHTATHCNLLYLTATHCSTLVHFSLLSEFTGSLATHWNTFQHLATHRCCIFLWVHLLVSSFASTSATHCDSLQFTATHCSELQHNATYHNTLQHTAAHCNTLQHTGAVAFFEWICRCFCNKLKHTAVLSNTMQHTVTHRCFFPLSESAHESAIHCNSQQPPPTLRNPPASPTHTHTGAVSSIEWIWNQSKHQANY